MKILIFIIFIAFSFGLPIYAAEINYTTDCGRFTFEDTTASLIAYTGNYANITIPDTINGVAVTNIRASLTFQGKSTIKSIIIPKTVTYIEQQAFHDCINLISIYFKGNAPTIGDNIFFNVNKDYKTYINRDAIGFSATTWANRPIEIINLNTYKLNYTLTNNVLNVTVANTVFIDGAKLICGVYKGKSLINPTFKTINKDTNDYTFDLSNYQKPFNTKLILLDSLNNLRPLSYDITN